MTYSYQVMAQSYTTSQRITKVVTAASAADALRQVGPELEAAGFYAVLFARFPKTSETESTK
jgi:hypothetical protein